MDINSAFKKLSQNLLKLIIFFSSIFCTQSDLYASKRDKLTDEQLLEKVQKTTFRYFWNFAHPESGLARERSNKTFGYGKEVVTSGGSGFGVMAIIVATERKWISRNQAAKRILKTVQFLQKSDSFHGVFPHWLDGETGKTIPFSVNDNGADLVETAYLMQGLLSVRQYFNQETKDEIELRSIINNLWKAVNWNWHTRNGENVLYWHWSPDKQWAMNHKIGGYNECLITYVLAASSPTYSINAEVYHQGWTQTDFFKNNKSFYNINLPLGFDYGGPLFFSHYSFLGLNPRGLKDRYADYWEQNVNHTLINRAYCMDNPKKFKGYGENCWGLTASDSYGGYAAHSPLEDLGVISPTAALSAFPYSPEHSMKALRHFYEDFDGKLWNKYGFIDAFSESKNWFADSQLAIDQGPIIIMIENYRTGLLWNLFMSCPEVQLGLKKLEFTYTNSSN